MRFLFRLALALGYCDPYQLLDVLPEGLFDQWEAYSTVEPFGYDLVQSTALPAATVRGGNDERESSSGELSVEERTKRTEREQALFKQAFPARSK